MIWLLAIICGYVLFGIDFLNNFETNAVSVSAGIGLEKDDVSERSDFSQNFFDYADVITRDTVPELISIRAVGDILLTREVARRSALSGSAIYPFLETAHYLEEADITFGNLETTVFDGEETGYKSMRFRSDIKMLDGLRFAGFDLLSLANNHIFNFGEEGILMTIENLDHAELGHCGAGKNLLTARKPWIRDVRGTKIAWLCYNDTDVVPNNSFATLDRAGTVEMTLENMQKDIDGLRGSVDFILVSMHSGSEYSSRPNKRQIRFARAAIDAGADIVIGHHPHVLQPVEYYKKGIILYSLGNFVFDQEGVTTNESVIADLLIDPLDRSIALNLIPVKIVNFSQPRLILDDRQGKKVVDKVLLNSRYDK